MSEFLEDRLVSARRLGNVISLLLPARSYKINCAWTQEVALPAVEDFACRLLLLFGELLPKELQGYFDLSTREREVLLDSLVKNKLVTINQDGYLTPAPLLSAKAKGSADEPTMLTSFEERSETAIFDLLTMSLLPRKSYDNSRFGLPEVPLERDRTIGNDDVIEAFSRQYRAHLENTRKNEHEVKRTRLYKTTSCEPDRTVQVPIDMDVFIEASDELEPRVYRDVVEKVGSIRRRALSNELESCIADYLAGLEVPSNGLTFEQFCHLVDDQVLLGYADGDSFDLSKWLVDREKKKTGYGSSLTTALFGPIYLKDNRVRIIKMLRGLKRDWKVDSVHKAFWLSSNVPLWAASGSDLADFSRKIENELAENIRSKGAFSALFNVDESSEHYGIKRKFETKIPNGLGISGSIEIDRLELFLIPGNLAVLQFHVQPNKSSSVTVPIGYITEDPERVALATELLKKRLILATDLDVIWSRSKLNEEALFDIELLGNRKDKFINRDVQAVENKEVKVTIKPKRKVISLCKQKQDN